MKIVRRFIIVLLVLVLAGYLGWNYIQKESTKGMIKASGTIETTEVEVGSRIGGRVKSILFNEGDMVKPGDILINFEAYQIPEQREELNAQLERAKVLLSEMIRGARPEEIAAAQAQYQQAQARANLVAEGAREEEIAQAEAYRRKAEADLEHARTNDQRFKTLFAKKVVSQQEMDNVNNTFKAAEEQFKASVQQEQELKRGNRPQEIIAAKEQARVYKEQYRLVKAGTRAEDIAAQKAVIKSIEAQIGQLNKTEGELVVKSSCTCQISSMDIRSGNLILPNESLATLTDLDDLWVRVYIPEERFGQIKPGDKVSVKVDPFPERLFQGKVVQLASRAEFTPRNVQTEESRKMQVFGIKIALDNKDRLLRPGMPADVTFILSST